MSIVQHAPHGRGRRPRDRSRTTSPTGAPKDARLGDLMFLHRFEASLNMHFHYHLVVLDGLVSGSGDLGSCFMQPVIQRRVLRYFRSQALLMTSTLTACTPGKAPEGSGSTPKSMATPIPSPIPHPPPILGSWSPDSGTIPRKAAYIPASPVIRA